MFQFINDIKIIKKYNLVINTVIVLLMVILFYMLLLIYLIIRDSIYKYDIILQFGYCLFCFIILVIRLNKFIDKYKLDVKDRLKYYVFDIRDDYNDNDLISRLDNIRYFKKKYEYSDDAVIYKFDYRMLIYRIMIVHLSDFIKHDFDKIRNNSNLNFNKKYERGFLYRFRYGNRTRSHIHDCSVRLYIIRCDNETDELYRYVSLDACQNMRRSESVLNVILLKNKLLIPSVRSPIESVCNRRYIKTVKLLCRLFDINM